MLNLVPCVLYVIDLCTKQSTLPQCLTKVNAAKNMSDFCTKIFEYYKQNAIRLVIQMSQSQSKERET